MPVVIRETETQVDSATATAIEDVHAALSAGKVNPAAAAATAGGPVGHGTIRLRVASSDRGASHAEAAPRAPSSHAGPVGHGAIRLRGRTSSPQSEPGSAATASA